MPVTREIRATRFRTDRPFEFPPSLSMRQIFGKNSQKLFQPKSGGLELHLGVNCALIPVAFERQRFFGHNQFQE
jgi:hypothetical protein